MTCCTALSPIQEESDRLVRLSVAGTSASLRVRKLKAVSPAPDRLRGEEYAGSPARPVSRRKRQACGGGLTPEAAALAERDALYSTFAALARRLTARYGDDPEMREELKSEIYFRFCALLDAYDPARNVPLRPYMVCQLSSSIYTYARQQRLKRRREVNLDIEPDALPPAFVVNPSAQWDESLVMQQVRKHLPAVLPRLSARQQEVVRMRYYEDRSYEEIAGCLNVQPATVRSILRYALQNLRRLLEQANVTMD